VVASFAKQSLIGAEIEASWGDQFDWMLSEPPSQLGKRQDFKPLRLLSKDWDDDATGDAAKSSTTRSRAKAACGRMT